MDLLLTYKQEKKDNKSDSVSTCDLNLYSNHTNIEYVGVFDFDYQRYGTKKQITFRHSFNLNILTGDVIVGYELINNNLTRDRLFKTTSINKKNSFDLLFELTENGFYRGEKRLKYWGVKYERFLTTIHSTIYKTIQPHFRNSFIKKKDYRVKSTINPLYDMLVDYHLDLKNIKQHDNVYQDIKYEYPKKKWLLKNDNKFLPSVLESYGIKSKYLIGELSKDSQKSKHIRSVNYFCKLFGENYIDYLKQIDWSQHCNDLPSNRKIHKLRNDIEKKSMVKLINNWNSDTMKSDSLIYNLQKLLTIRDLVDGDESLIFKAKSYTDFENLLESWLSIKSYLNRGYRLKYDFPKEFVQSIESKIIVEGEMFQPKILVSEEDFRIEGSNMKNCMSKQFVNGSLFIYVALYNKNKRINLQYRRGSISQQYGKANSSVDTIFHQPIQVLNERFKNLSNITWGKVKYDILSN
jgi:hypothetical protein